MKHVMIVLTLCMLVACGRSQQETSLAWKTDSLVRMSDSTLLIPGPEYRFDDGLQE